MHNSKSNYFEIVLISNKKNKIILEKIDSNKEHYQLPFVIKDDKIKTNKDFIESFTKKYGLYIELKDLIFLGKIEKEKEEINIFLVSLPDNFFDKHTEGLSIFNLDQIDIFSNKLYDYLKWLLILIKYEKVNNVEISLKYINDY